MILLLTILSTTMLWVSAAGAQETASTGGKDILGWEAARWGMTEAEAMAALPGMLKRAKDDGFSDKSVRFTLGYKTKFATVKGRLELGFATSDGRLAKVLFRPEGYWEEFLALEKHLTAEYGPRGPSPSSKARSS